MTDDETIERFQRLWGYLGPQPASVVRAAIDEHHAMGLCTAGERRALLRAMGLPETDPPPRGP